MNFYRMNTMVHAIEDYPVPLIFKKVFKETISGTLTVTSENFSKQLYFVNGNLKFASTSLKQERLGEMLVKRGKLKKKQFVALLQERKKTGCKLGMLLVKHSILSRKELFIMLHEQVKEIALSSFAVVTGKWSFTPGPPEIPGKQNFEVAMPELLMEGVTLIPDFSFYKKRFNFSIPRTMPIPESVGRLLPADQMRFYLKLTKCPTHTCAEIIAMMKLPEKVFWRRLILLYILDAIDFVQFKADSKISKKLEGIDELMTKLKRERSDHYDQLELTDTAAVSKVKDQYFSFVEKPSPPPEITDFEIVSIGENPDVPAGKVKKKPSKETKKS
jgi:hypothetical protein